MAVLKRACATCVCRRARVGKAALDPNRMEVAWVFHGGAHDVVENIIVNGFNRSYAGKNATAYGPGSCKPPLGARIARAVRPVRCCARALTR